MRLPDRQDLPGAKLLTIARASIEHGLVHLEPLPVTCDGLPRELTAPAATFTTLRIEGELRGCCGTLEAARPLAADVARSSFQAAFRDSRFEPLRGSELESIRLEVSVLSAMEAIPVKDEADLLRQLRPGVDGLVMVEGVHQATFLPKVWEQLEDPGQFLAALKRKCGLPTHYWSEQLSFLRYQATTYREAA
jgi:AmmeMemoRadiSam system protein A